MAAATFQNTVAVAVAVLLWFFLLIFLFLTMFFPRLLFCKFQQRRYNTSKPVGLQTSGSPSQMKPAIALKASLPVNIRTHLCIWEAFNLVLVLAKRPHWLQRSSERLRNCIGSKNCGSPNLWISKPVTLASWWWASSANLTKTYKDLVYLATATFQNTVSVAVAVFCGSFCWFSCSWRSSSHGCYFANSSNDAITHQSQWVSKPVDLQVRWNQLLLWKPVVACQHPDPPLHLGSFQFGFGACKTTPLASMLERAPSKLHWLEALWISKLVDLQTCDPCFLMMSVIGQLDKDIQRLSLLGSCHFPKHRRRCCCCFVVVLSVDFLVLDDVLPMVTILQIPAMML